MTREEIRRKAILAAATVVLAMGCKTGGGAGGGDGYGADSMADSASDSPVDSLADSGADDSGADTAGGKPDCAAEELDITACCDALMAWCGDNVAQISYDECVYGPGFDGSTGCIPWGPAVPPSARVA